MSRSLERKRLSQFRSYSDIIVLKRACNLICLCLSAGRGTRAALDLTRVEKGEVIPDNAVPKSYFPQFVENYYWVPQYEFGDQTVKARKNSQQKGFVTRFWNSR